MDSTPFDLQYIVIRMAGMGFPCSGFQNYNFCISRLKFTCTLIKDTKLMERESSKECSQCSVGDFHVVMTRLSENVQTTF